MSGQSKAAVSRDAGFTLVEILVVCVIVGVLAAVALPAYQQRGLRTGRMDAVSALTRLQGAQEQYRSLHGMYANDMSALTGVAPVSAQGRYAVTLERMGPDSYLASATARGTQADDKACRQITLRVTSGFPTEGPSTECWGR